MKPIDLRMEGTHQGAIEIARNRIIFIIVLFTIGFLMLAVKLISIGIFQAHSSSYYPTVNSNGSLLMARADIVDRNGVVLATNLKAPSLAVSKRNLKSPPKEIATKIAAIFPEITYDDVIKILRNKANHSWIKRKLTPKQLYAIKQIGDPGLEISDAEKRIYPHGRLLAHVLGALNIDNKPLSGIEAYFDGELSDPAKSEEPITLSIDIRLQHILNQELSLYKEKFLALGAAGIILDVTTGEILALSSIPDFDPNDGKGPLSKVELNRILQGSYELGSGFKTFTIASGLDNNVIRQVDSYDATYPLRVGGFTIRDDHPKKRWLSVQEIFVYSSNIGTIKIAQDIGIEIQKEFFEKLGLFSKTKIEVFEKTSPQLPKQWGPTELATTAYGHGIAVTPLHLASGVAAMVNGGRLIPATLIRKDIVPAALLNFVSSKVKPDNTSRQVISSKTSEIMRKLLHFAVEEGTGKKAKVEGYEIGGKTGTAIKPFENKRGYDDKAVISSFISIFPINDPKYLIFAMLDEPQGIEETFNLISAGMTAAPLVGNIISRVGPLMGIPTTHKGEKEYDDFMLVSGTRK